MTITPEALIASADEIDNRLGPIPGRSSDRIARELRAAAALIAEANHLHDEPQKTPQRVPMIAAVASLAAAISLLERTPKAKKAAPSDKMFEQMLADYRKALANARDALTLSRPSRGGAE